MRASVPRAIVAIPVRNERDRIVACMMALAAQVGVRPCDIGIVLFLNNCTDDSASIVAAIDMPCPVRIVERTDPIASAGWARRIAMDVAAAWLAEGQSTDGVLLTTDADSTVAPDWVARNLAALDAGADLVAGRIRLDPAEAARLPAHLHARGRLEAAYEALLIEIEARLDPEPGNPWPCHWSKSGATLAVRHAIYSAVGGMPSMPTGEDRAFVDAVRAQDFVVRHACDIEVVTSGRLDGRAAGGVAETIKLRCDVPESFCDDRLESAGRLVARVLCRRWVRRLHRSGGLDATWRWAPAFALDCLAARDIAALPTFGSIHAAIERESMSLSYRPLRPRQLPRQIRRAEWILRSLTFWERLRRAPQAVRQGQRAIQDRHPVLEQTARTPPIVVSAMEADAT